MRCDRSEENDCGRLPSALSLPSSRPFSESLSRESQSGASLFIRSAKRSNIAVLSRWPVPLASIGGPRIVDAHASDLAAGLARLSHLGSLSGITLGRLW